MLRDVDFQAQIDCLSAHLLRALDRIDQLEAAALVGELRSRDPQPREIPARRLANIDREAVSWPKPRAVPEPIMEPIAQVVQKPVRASILKTDPALRERWERLKFA